MASNPYAAPPLLPEPGPPRDCPAPGILSLPLHWQVLGSQLPNNLSPNCIPLLSPPSPLVSVQSSLDLLASGANENNSGLSIGSVNSNQIPNASNAQRGVRMRKRRTKAELAADSARSNKPKRTATSSSVARSSQSSRSQNPGTSSRGSVVLLEKVDYEHICSYIEEDDHYKDLFGHDEETPVGVPVITKARAWDLFADYLNSTNSKLQLSGRKLQQRFATYKDRYRRAKDFENNTGAGILETEGYDTLAEKLNSICPCYDRMDALFGTKPNVVPMGMLDSTGDVELNDVQIRMVDEDDRVDQNVGEDDRPANESPGNPDGDVNVECNPGLDSSRRASDPDRLDDSSQLDNAGESQSARESQPNNITSPLESSTRPESHTPIRTLSQQTNVDQGPPSSVQPGRSTIPNFNRLSGASNIPGSTPSQSSRSTTNKGSTLAGALETTTNARMSIMNRQLSLDERRFNLEEAERTHAREQRDHERKEREEQQKQRTAEREARMKAVQEWLAEGRSPLEIQILVQAVFGP